MLILRKGLEKKRGNSLLPLPGNKECAILGEIQNEVKTMQTQAIYYEDGYRSRFTATVLSCEVRENNYAVTLDATAFYPEGFCR